MIDMKSESPGSKMVIKTLSLKAFYYSDLIASFISKFPYFSTMYVSGTIPFLSTFTESPTD